MEKNPFSEFALLQTSSDKLLKCLLILYVLPRDAEFTGMGGR